MSQLVSIVARLRDLIDDDPAAKSELEACISAADWTPPYRDTPISDTEGFYEYLNTLLHTTPSDATFSDMFHGLYFIVSQLGNKFQTEASFAKIKDWMVLLAEQYGSFLNTPQSANDLSTFLNDPAFVIDNFEIPPGGFNNWNSFFCRHIRPGKRPIGAKTLAYENSSSGLAPNPDEDRNEIHKNMADDNVITVPADSVFEGAWSVSDTDTVTVSKGNTYSIENLLKRSKYAERFKNGFFTHSYLTVLTYHRYHTPVRGTVLEAGVLSGDVYAAVSKDAEGHLSASDATGYQFRQERGLFVIDSPVGLVALLPIGMDVISSVNFMVDAGDYVNK
ncbi:MAG: phosphatidylserine decarboxylase, partial [Actinobacteria bacterium]|nr:phosphatidylserine decarboxylase [Actinomycetota bacterium]